MKRTGIAVAVALAGTLTLAACGGQESAEAPPASETTAASEQAQPTEGATMGAESHGSATDAAGEHGAHEHPEDGGPPPAGIVEATNPTYTVGEKVRLTADHMPGMDGAEATIAGAFTTTTYAVSYTPTDDGPRVTDHKWVVHEELQAPSEDPLKPGDTAMIDAEHMAGMKGAEATIDSVTEETVYMVDIETPEMTQKNHKWVVESEIEPLS